MPNLNDYPDWMKPPKDRATEIWVGTALVFVTLALAVGVFRLVVVLG